MNCIVMGVTGGIAAYKAVEIARQFTVLGFDVKVLMTEHATNLVGPATFHAITGNPVAVSMFASTADPIQHITLAKEADLVVIAPATANILAKMAKGLADDLLSTTLLATRAPLLVAPAMNVHMWQHPATRANVEELRRRGLHFIGPESGSLACGDEGEGRMSEPDQVVEAALQLLGLKTRLAGKNVMVSAGGTREPIDPVRYIGNRSSGKMGYALAVAAKRMGAKVTLVSGPTALVAPQGVEVIEVETAQDMWLEITARAAGCHAVVMAAAVADFTPAARETEKIKKEGRAVINLELEATRDILKHLCREKYAGQVIVGFAAETGALLPHAQAKLKDKGADLLVANDVTAAGSAFDSDYNRATLLFADGRVLELDMMPKADLAVRVWEEVAGLLET
jgi:phosphopantothenoylcysteine decarboxylase / phosphopantothenate---cysteine ligase